MGFKENLKIARSKAGLTQKALAERAGISYSYITKLESGELCNPTYEILEALSDALRTPLGAAVSEAHPAFALSPDAVRIGRLYEKADRRAREIVDFTLRPFEDGTIEMSGELLPDFTQKTTRLLRISRLGAAAGTGVFLDDEQFDLVEVRNNIPPSAEFGVPITGDSMEPGYPNGWIAWIQPTVHLRVGEIGLFSYDEMGYIKKWGGDRLISVNPKYADILLREGVRFDVFGRVVAVTDGVG